MNTIINTIESWSDWLGIAPTWLWVVAGFVIFLTPFVLRHLLHFRPINRSANRRLRLLRKAGDAVGDVNDFSQISILSEREKRIATGAILKDAGSTTIGPLRDEAMVGLLEEQFITEFLRELNRFGYPSTRVFRTYVQRQLQNNKGDAVLGDRCLATAFAYSLDNETSVVYFFTFELSGMNVILRSCRYSNYSHLTRSLLATLNAEQAWSCFIPGFGQLLWLVQPIFLLTQLLDRKQRNYDLVAGGWSGINREFTNDIGFEGHSEVHDVFSRVRERLANEWLLDYMQ